MGDSPSCAAVWHLNNWHYFCSSRQQTCLDRCMMFFLLTLSIFQRCQRKKMHLKTHSGLRIRFFGTILACWHVGPERSLLSFFRRARLESSCWPRRTSSWLTPRRARWRPAFLCRISPACQSARRVTVSLLSNSKRWGGPDVVNVVSCCYDPVVSRSWFDGHESQKAKACWDMKVVEHPIRNF